MVAAVFGAQAVAIPAANADDKTVLRVVGTSDVSDSNLMKAVIEPGFEAAYPQFDLQYTGKATSTAIGLATSGNADALIVHAASLENQFVADGYSAEPFGRAIFWGDFVLAGPANDPAGVLSSAPHDIVTAFEKIAAAGVDGKATFVSRGGGAGTTVQEHAIWALTQTGIPLCTVTAANGGGATPNSVAGDCPSTPAPSSYPTWYSVTGQTQGPNVQSADSCPTATFPNGGCYVFTDRGTFQYLQSESALSQLQVVTRDNAATARGSNTALVNSFHAYALNQAAFPAGSNVTIQTAGATDLLNWLTSPAAQSAIGAYLQDQGGPAFLPSAAPSITAYPLPASVTAGAGFVVRGTLANVVPGTPALGGVTVSLQAVPASDPLRTPVTVATGRTSSTGAFTIGYKPSATQLYSLSTPALSKIENAALNPPFGDLLAASQKGLSTVTVKPVAVTPPPAPPKPTTSKSTVSIDKITVHGLVAKVVVHFAPHPSVSTATLKVYAHRTGQNSSSLVLTRTIKIKKAADGLAFNYKLGTAGHSWKTRVWKFKVVYSGPHIVTSTSTTHTVTVH